MSASSLIVIFGAAVKPDGRPSQALLRRIGYGFAAAKLQPEAPVLCSGGIGRAGPSEASIMAQVLTGWGLSSDRLIVDEASRDTLQSVVVAARLAREQSAELVLCSDGYHLPRIRLMLGALGVATVRGPVPRGPLGVDIGHWLRMSLREGAAIPYDLAIVLARKGALLS